MTYGTIGAALPDIEGGSHVSEVGAVSPDMGLFQMKSRSVHSRLTSLRIRSLKL